MLASIQSVSEAQILLNEPVDILDIKNPAEGALGALPLTQITQILSVIDKKMVSSATIGNIAMNDPELISYINNIAETGVDYVKVGVFGCDISNDFIETLRDCAKRDIAIILVLFAEYYRADNLQILIDSQCKGMMLDTSDKHSGGLLDKLTSEQIKNFTQQIKAIGLLSGLAGALKIEQIPELCRYNADYLGFRTALCHKSERQATIQIDQVSKIKKMLMP